MPPPQGIDGAAFFSGFSATIASVLMTKVGEQSVEEESWTF